MKKEIIIAAIFIAMFAMSLVNVACLERITADVASHAEAAADAMLEGDTALAELEATEAFEIWQKNSFYLLIVLRHTVYEIGESSLIALLTEIYSGSEGGTLGKVEAVRRSMEGIVGSERVRIGSIF